MGLPSKIQQTEKRLVGKIIDKAPWTASKPAVAVWFTVAGLCAAGALLLFIFSFSGPPRKPGERNYAPRIVFWTGVMFLGLGVAVSRERKLREARP